MTNAPQPIAESTLSIIPQCIAFASAVQGGECSNSKAALLYLRARKELETVVNAYIAKNGGNDD